MASRSVQPFFAQLTAECPFTLQWADPFPSVPFTWGSGSPSAWFHEPTRDHNPNGISIDLAVFAGLTIVTDRPTDRPRKSIYNNRPHIRSTAMQPNNRPNTQLQDLLGSFYYSTIRECTFPTIIRCKFSAAILRYRVLTHDDVRSEANG